MTDDSPALPVAAPFGEGLLPVSVIVVWSNDRGWRVTTVAVRTDSGPVDFVPPWSEIPLGFDGSTIDRMWAYLAERIVDGRGGNGYTYEIEGFEVGNLSDVAPHVYARAAEAVAATHGPLGEIVGTLIRSGGVTVLPFVVLRDDRQHFALVTASPMSDIGAQVVREDDHSLVEPVPFESVDHWQRKGETSWPVTPGPTYVIDWYAGRARFAVTQDGHLRDVEAVT